MLEVKIEALTIAIERLTAQLQGQPAIDLETPKPKAKEPKAHLRMEKSLSIEPTPPKASAPTKEALRDLFIAKTRDNAENKAKIKELLKLYGATKINDLEDGDIAEIFEEAQSL